MKGMIFMLKKLISSILALGLVASMAGAFATNDEFVGQTEEGIPVSENVISVGYDEPVDVEIELPVDEMEDGITVAIFQDDNGEFYAEQVTENSVMPTSLIVSTFHVGLIAGTATNKYRMYWDASGDRLTAIYANLVCKNTGNGTVYGTENVYFSSTYGQSSASGTTSDFTIPSNISKVKVGWSAATIVSMGQGKVTLTSVFQERNVPR